MASRCRAAGHCRAQAAQCDGTLEEACKGTSIGGKQGALFAFECLVARLGLLFEPYVIVILPLLLKACSDASDHVRDAAQGTARVVMANLTAHGVKLVLPKMLEALEDSAWRTKQAAIQLLGAMAYCAPRQLSSCLPQIVPRLTSASATPPKVQAAGRAALQDIGLVVRNPVSQLLPTIMVALSDPAKQTKSALDALLACGSCTPSTRLRSRCSFRCCSAGFATALPTWRRRR